MGWLGIKKGVQFNDKHTYRDYGMYMSGRPEIGQPEPKIIGADILGADGTLDLTEATTGEVKFSNREIVLRFFKIVEIEDQQELKSRIYNDLHGKKMQIILDEDSNYYYYGRCSVTFENPEACALIATVTVDADPYKYEREQVEMVVPIRNFSAVRIPYNHIRVQSSPDAVLANTLFPVGTAGNNMGDFSSYSQIIIGWGEQTPTTEIVISVKDRSQNEYVERISAPPTGPQAAGAIISMSTIAGAGVDTSDILFIRVMGRSNCTLEAVADYGMHISVYNGRMSVVPTFDAPASGLEIIMNGKKFRLNSGVSKDPELYLHEGENDFFVLGNQQQQNEQLGIYYRRGGL